MALFYMIFVLLIFIFYVGVELINSVVIVSATQQSIPIIHILCMHSESLQSWPTFWDPRTVAHQVPMSMGFSRQEYWSGLPCPLPGDLPNPGNGSASLMSPALAGGFFTTSANWEVLRGSILPQTPLLYRLPHNIELLVLNGRCL